jgi:signal transduction histidine kinase
MANPVFVNIILRNLIGNALRFTTAGSITVSVNERDGRACIEVRDGGTGIAPERFAPGEDGVPKLFRIQTNPSTHDPRGKLGTGFGLPSCYDLVLAIGGELEVESRLADADGQNGGTTLRVLLPLSAEE